MAISGNTQRPSRRSAVRHRRPGQPEPTGVLRPVNEDSTAHGGVREDTVVDVETLGSDNLQTDPATLPRD